jgi:hypothetical protein
MTRKTTAILVLGLGMASCAGGGSDSDGAADDDDDVSDDVSDDGNSDSPAGIDAGASGPPPTDLIDDLDDGDGALPPRGGRKGAWYTYNDMSTAGTQMPPAGVAFLPTPGGPGASVYHASTQGDGFSVWGAGMGFDLNNPNNPDGKKLSYDASAFRGITFKARGTVPIRASVMVAGVLSTEIGGTCTPSTTAGEGCDDGHGRSLFLTPEWQTYQLTFDQITQAGWGKPVVFDATQIMAVQFNIDKGLAFDVAIDDIGFY